MQINSKQPTDYEVTTVHFCIKLYFSTHHMANTFWSFTNVTNLVP